MALANSRLTEGPLPKHIRNITLPMSIGLFFNTMYNVVDSYYAGQVSTTALAAMAVSFPVFFVIISFSEGIARGASALIANAIGAGDGNKESVLSSQVFLLGLFVSIGLTILGLNASETLFRWMGVPGSYLDLSESYVAPLFIGSVFFLLSSLSNAILLAHGDTRTFGIVLVAGFFLNLVLDPWFLHGGFGLKPLGIPGIAWATVLIQALGGLYLFATVLRRGHVQWGVLIRLRPQLKIYGEILQQGVPTSFNMMSIALGFFVITYYLNLYGEVAVAAFGIGTRIEQIALLPAIGLGSAIISIVGQNNGAGKMDRVRECVRLCVKYGFVLIIVASVPMFLFATPLIAIFTDDPAVISTGTTYIRIMTFIQWAYIMSFVYTGFLQAVKRPMYGFCESVVRKLILPLILFHALVKTYEVSLDQFWFGMVAINVVMALITVAYGQWVLRKIVLKTESSAT